MELQKTPNDNFKKFNYHVFQIIDTEKKSEFDLYQKNMAELKYNVDILKEFGAFKSKIPHKAINRKTRTHTRNRTRLFRNHSLINENVQKSSKSLDKLLLNKYYIQNNKNEQSVNNKKNKENSKDKKNINKIRNKINLTKNNTIKNNNEIFITNFPLNTENTNNTLSRYSEYIRNSQRNNMNNKQSYSLSTNLPPIKNRNSFANNFKNNGLNSLNEKYSYLNTLINDDNKTSNNIKEKYFSYVQTEGSLINAKNKQRILKINENVVLNMIKNNKKIINNIRHIKNEIEDASIDFETKFKYYNWKYGIADMNKYFIDILAYKKNEQDLINKKKSFYDKLDDIIEDVKKQKKNKEFMKIMKQFGAKVKKDDDHDDKNNDNDEYEKIFSKNIEVKNSLKELYKRQRIERIKRDKIKDILVKSKDRFNNIKIKLDGYKIKERQLKEI